MRRTKNRALSPYAAAVLLVLAAAPGARAQNAAGYVASVNGTWFTSARPMQPVSAGRVVAQGEEVWAAARASAGAYLTVVLRDGSRLALNCSVPGDCDRRHTLRVRQGLLPGVGRMFDAVLDLVRRNPEVFVSLITRADKPHPADVVVPGDEFEIDVSAVFAEPGVDRYRVSLRPITAQKGSVWIYIPEDEEPVAVLAWSAGQPLVYRGVPPGLYELRAESRSGRHAQVWVLVSHPATYVQAAADFARAKEMVSAWTGMDAAYDARAFLRAYLAALALSAPPRPGR